MDKINKWLQDFKNSWESHNIKEVLKLFDKNVVYYETPFYKLNNFEELAKEWEIIHNQKNISLSYNVFSKSENKYSVIWSLEYFNIEGKKQNFKGTYLIELNENNLCTYFHHSCESQ